MVMVAAYGGSFIAYLTVVADKVPLGNLEDLVSQTRYRWGTNKGSAYISEFRVSL